MLYEKSKSKELDPALFEKPTSEYRAAPFWSWNCKLEREELLRQIDCFKEMGFGGAHIHSRTGLDTAYLGDEFMGYVRDCVRKSKENKMLTWLYDEDRWSSGPAGGKVTAYKPYRRKRLMAFSEDQGWNTPKEQALEEGVPYLIGCYDVTLKDGCLDAYRRIDPAESAAGRKWYVYVVNEKESTWFNGQTYIDAMDKEAIGAFLKSTHERYREFVGEEFGKTVPAIFTDEPNVNHERTCVMPSPDDTGRIVTAWSRFFEEEYRAFYGEDLLDKLPELFWIRKDRSDSAVKYKYFNLVAELFARNFSCQIGVWCDKNGIKLTGHLLREPTLHGQTVTCGETMRNYGEFGIPGIDMLCDAVELTTAKQTQSAVHQYGKEGMLSELYGVTGWTFDFRGHKFQGDWQAALGVTVRVPHLAWASMAGEAKRDYPAAIGYQSPWYKDYKIIEDHFARVNTVLTRGKPVVKIGVVHPSESMWISMGPNTQMYGQVSALEENFRSVTEWLLGQHLDFDYICEATLPALSGEDPRAVGEMRYDAIVVPGCLTLRRSTLDFFGKFRAAGGKVVFMGVCPQFVDGVKSDAAEEMYAKCERVPFDKAALTAALDDERIVTVTDDSGKTAENIVYALRKDGGDHWLFLAHARRGVSAIYSEAPQDDVVPPLQMTLKIRGAFTPTLYDTMTGDRRQIPYEIQNGVTVIRHRVDGYDSVLLRLAPAGETRPAELPAEKRRVSDRYTLKQTVPYALEEPNVLLLDRAEYAVDGGEFQAEEEILRLDNNVRQALGLTLRDGKLAQPYTTKAEKPTHTLCLRFTFESDRAQSGVKFAAEDLETLSVRLNGEDVAVKPDGWFTDRCIRTTLLPDIRKGKNELLVSMPFGVRTNVEWCYLLGDFGVRVAGAQTVMTASPDRIGFSDIVPQGMPFYGGNIRYDIPLTLDKTADVTVHASCYRGALIGVAADGKDAGRIILPPYDLTVENVPAGAHTLSLTVFGNRQNSFGPVHNVDRSDRWIGPRSWRTTGDNWCYEYGLSAFGLLKSPVITITEKENV